MKYHLHITIQHPERRIAREASPLGHPVKIIKISLESKLSRLIFMIFTGC